MDEHSMWTRFNEIWKSLVSRKRGNKVSLSNAEYQDRVTQIKQLKEALRTGEKIRSQNDSRILRMYDVVTVCGREWLVKPSLTAQVANNQLALYVTNEELFDVLHKVHLNTNHGHEEPMIDILRAKYCNVTREAVLVYLGVCCGNPKRMVVRSSVFMETPRMEVQQQYQLPMTPSPQPYAYGSSVFFGFYGMENYACNGYSHIMIHWDVSTKFVHLVPLPSVQAMHVAGTLLDIYATFGMPYFLDAPYEVSYIKSIVNHIKSMWNGEVFIEYRKSSILDTLLRGLTTIHQIMDPWVKDVDFQQNWPLNLKVLQFRLNSQLFPGSALTPYQQTFGFQAYGGNGYYNM